MTEPLRLGLIFGGRSIEHEVSVISALDVINAADRDRFEVVPIGVTKSRVWLSPAETRRQLERDDPPFQKRMQGEVEGGASARHWRASPRHWPRLTLFSP